MKRVLIVSPRFPPVNAPDHQRVRMMLPHIAKHGWKATVLAVSPDLVDAPVEPELLTTVPDDVEIVHCRAVPQRVSRRVGVGSLSLRAMRAMRAAGNHLLASRKFDLVFFSTTEFGLIALGRGWKRRFGIPFVVDLQDPWVNDHYSDSGAPPPGGAFKFAVTQAIARMQEGPTLSDAAHIISVSPGYPSILQRRYAALEERKFSVIPFGGSRRDFEVAGALPPHEVFPAADGRRHWLYAGTAPPGIRLAVTGLLLALRRAFDEGIVARDEVRVHFVGTDYAPAELARPRVVALADEQGMGDVVDEHPARIPYLRTLQCLQTAGALLVLGWDDPAYTASKLYPYILAGRPLLSVLHEASSANQVMWRTRAGIAVCFNEATTPSQLADEIFNRWFVTRAFEAAPQTDWNEFRPFTAEEMTARVAAVFDAIPQAS